MLVVLASNPPQASTVSCIRVPFQHELTDVLYKRGVGGQLDDWRFIAVNNMLVLRVTLYPSHDYAEWKRHRMLSSTRKVLCKCPYCDVTIMEPPKMDRCLFFYAWSDYMSIRNQSEKICLLPAHNVTLCRWAQTPEIKACDGNNGNTITLKDGNERYEGWRQSGGSKTVLECSSRLRELQYDQASHIIILFLPVDLHTHDDGVHLC